MKILMLTTRFPFPLTQGDRLRSYHQMALLSKSHQITLVSSIEDDCDTAGIDRVGEFCESMALFPITQQRRIKNIGRVSTYDFPFQIPQWFSQEIQRRVQRLLAAETFDVIYLQMAKAVLYLPKGNSVPVVVDFVDAWSLNLARLARDRNWITAAFYLLQSWRMLNYERKVTAQVNHAIISSVTDQKAIGAFNNLSVVPNGVRYPDQPIVHVKNAERLSIVFVGNMAYAPNIAAITYFAQHVFPMLRSRHDDCELIVIGPNPPEKLVRTCSQAGVQFLGYVPDLNEYLERATVSIAPMRSGSGIQNKVLEAMAAGIPVIATTVGLGGLRAIPGEHLLVADTPYDFTDAILRVFHNPSLRQNLVRKARALVKDFYSWEASVQALDDIYQDVTQSDSTVRVASQQFPTIPSFTSPGFRTTDFAVQCNSIDSVQSSQ